MSNKWDFENLIMTIYGKAKIGKSALCNALNVKKHFFRFESGAKFLLNNEGTDISDWESYISAKGKIKSSNAGMYVFDSLSAMIEVFRPHFYSKMNIKHEYGPYSTNPILLARNFANELYELQHLGKGIIIICHEISREENGRTIYVPDTYKDNHATCAKDSIEKMLFQMSDLVLRMYMDSKIVGGGTTQFRALGCQELETFYAGGRIELPPTIPLMWGDKQPDGSYVDRPANATESAKLLMGTYNDAVKKLMEVK